MKLIAELTEDIGDYLIENTASGKMYAIEGRWATADEKNKNGRIYPKAVMESALKKYDEEYIKQKRAMSELGHPQGPQINLDRVSHIIENLKMEGTYVIGRAKVMDTPMGKIVKNLMDEGVRLGVSTRGLGSLQETNGTKIVQPDFFITAIDIVSDPSGPGCFVNNVMESTEYMLTDDGRIIEKASEIIVESIKNRVNESMLAEQFTKLLNMISESNGAVVVDHSSYVRSHMKAPKGSGAWMFSTARSVDFSKHKEGDHYISVNGSLGDAKKKAQEWAKSKGHRVLYTQP